MPLPLIPLISAGAGLAQTIFGASRAKKTQRELENMQSPKYTANKGILDYYNQALARYNVNPTESALYKRQMQNVGRNTAAGLMGLQDRRSALAGTSSLLRAANDASLDASVAAEQQRDQRFSQLGGAAEAKAGEERTAFNVNEMQPFERKYNLLAMKAGAANEMANSGLSNIFSGLQNYGMAKYYGNNGGSGDSWAGRTGRAATPKTSINRGFYGTKYGNLYR